MITLSTSRFNTKIFYALPRECICFFCMVLNTFSGYFLVSHNLLVLGLSNEIKKNPIRGDHAGLCQSVCDLVTN
jgi:hypothetical protein